MKQEEAATDEQAKQFLQEWALEPGRFANTHLQSEGFRGAMNNYEHARLGLKKSVADALQHALDIASLQFGDEIKPPRALMHDDGIAKLLTTLPPSE